MSHCQTHALPLPMLGCFSLTVRGFFSCHKQWLKWKVFLCRCPSTLTSGLCPFSACVRFKQNRSQTSYDKTGTFKAGVQCLTSCSFLSTDRQNQNKWELPTGSLHLLFSRPLVIGTSKLDKCFLGAVIDVTFDPHAEAHHWFKETL